MPDHTLTQDDRSELFAAYISRFAAGEIGSATFREACREIQIPRDDIELAIKDNLKSNVLNWRNRYNL